MVDVKTLFVVLVLIVFAAGLRIGASLNGKRHELFTSKDVVKNLISSTDVEGKLTLPGEAGLKFLGTFVVAQTDKDTPLTLIDSIADVEDWECTDGVCTGRVTFDALEDNREPFTPNPPPPARRARPLTRQKRTVRYGRNAVLA